MTFFELKDLEWFFFDRSSFKSLRTFHQNWRYEYRTVRLKTIGCSLHGAADSSVGPSSPGGLPTPRGIES